MLARVEFNKKGQPARISDRGDTYLYNVDIVGHGPNRKNPGGSILTFNLITSAEDPPVKYMELNIPPATLINLENATLEVKGRLDLTLKGQEKIETLRKENFDTTFVNEIKDLCV